MSHSKRGDATSSSPHFHKSDGMLFHTVNDGLDATDAHVVNGEYRTL